MRKKTSQTVNLKKELERQKIQEDTLEFPLIEFAVTAAIYEMNDGFIDSLVRGYEPIAVKEEQGMLRFYLAPEDADIVVLSLLDDIEAKGLDINLSLVNSTSKLM